MIERKLVQTTTALAIEENKPEGKVQDDYT
jgi:hypothetical protein